MAFGFAGAAAGAQDELQAMLVREFQKRQAEQQIALQQQQLAQQASQFTSRMEQDQAELGFRKQQHADDQTYRTGQVERQATQDRAVENQRGTRRMIGDFLIARGGKPIGSGERQTLSGMAVSEDVDLPNEITTDPQQELADYEAKQKIAARYRPPPGGAPDYEWVLRNGTPVQIVKGQSQPGDTPYRAPLTSAESAQDRQRAARTSAARDFLARLNTLRTKINTKMGPSAGATGIVRRGGAALGMDPDVAEYERIRAAGGRALAVAIMGAQNLSDQDANAWANMLPDARTDEQTAKRLTAQVEQMLNGMTSGAQPAGPAPMAPMAAHSAVQPMAAHASPPAAAAGSSQPKVGDVKTFPNGRKGRWDGRGWVPVP